MIQTGEVRNNENVIQTNIEPLVDMGSLDLLSNTLNCPLTRKPDQFWQNLDSSQSIGQIRFKL